MGLLPPWPCSRSSAAPSSETLSRTATLVSFDGTHGNVAEMGHSIVERAAERKQLSSKNCELELVTDYGISAMQPTLGEFDEDAGEAVVYISGSGYRRRRLPARCGMQRAYSARREPAYLVRRVLLSIRNDVCLYAVSHATASPWKRSRPTSPLRNGWKNRASSRHRNGSGRYRRDRLLSTKIGADFAFFGAQAQSAVRKSCSRRFARGCADRPEDGQRNPK